MGTFPLRSGLTFDTCPSRAVFEEFLNGEPFRLLRDRHGLSAPERVEDFPVHAAFVEGAAMARVP